MVLFCLQDVHANLLLPMLCLIPLSCAQRTLINVCLSFSMSTTSAAERCSQCDAMRKKRSTGMWEVPDSDLLETPTEVNQMSNSLHLLEKRVSDLEESPRSCRYGNAVYSTGAKWLPAECLSCNCEVRGLLSCVLGICRGGVCVGVFWGRRVRLGME